MPNNEQEEPEDQRCSKFAVPIKFIQLALNVAIAILVSIDCYSIRKSTVFGGWFFVVLLISIVAVLVHICSSVVAKLGSKRHDALDYFGSMVCWLLYTFCGVCCLNVSIRTAPFNTVFVFLTAFIFIADIFLIADFILLHISTAIIQRKNRSSLPERDEQIESLIEEQQEREQQP